MDEKCCYQLEKPRKRQREGSKRKSTRLSDLPDSILHHILSFLTSKWAVQTSVLSRRWRCLWKYVPVLNLLSYSFFEYSQFVNFVDKVLSLRYQFKLDEITLEDFDDQSLDLYQKVIQYALSHDARHLVICIDSAIDFADLFGSMVYSNLESLVLTYICFNFGPSCFPKLTTLKLNGCLLVGPIDSDHDLSVKFPCLVNLDITDSEPSHFATRLKLYAPQLLNFKLSGSELLNIDVVAPRLESFILEPDYPSCDLVYANFSLSYVDRAEVLVDEKFFGKKELESHFDLLYSGLRNAKSIVLRCNTFKMCRKIRKFLEQKLSSFTRLKSLVCVSANPPTVDRFRVKYR